MVGRSQHPPLLKLQILIFSCNHLLRPLWVWALGLRLGQILQPSLHDGSPSTILLSCVCFLRNSLCRLCFEPLNVVPFLLLFCLSSYSLGEPIRLAPSFMGSFLDYHSQTTNNEARVPALRHLSDLRPQWQVDMLQLPSLRIDLCHEPYF